METKIIFRTLDLVSRKKEAINTRKNTIIAVEILCFKISTSFIS